MKWYSVNFFIAFTHLFSNKRQTLFALLGVTFGIGMFILMISVMNGVNIYTEEIMLAVTPDLRIYNDIKTDAPSILSKVFDKEDHLLVVHHPKPKEVQRHLKDGFKVVESIQNDERVLVASPLAATQVFYNYGPVQINGILMGVNILEEDQLFDLKEKVQAGRMEGLLTNKNSIFMGSRLAKKLNIQVGDLVKVTTPQGISLRLRVVGTYKTGINAIDDVRSYVNVSTVQQLLGEDNQYITDINVKLKDYNTAKAVAEEYTSKFGFITEDWQTANQSILESFVIRHTMTFVVSFTMLVVAGFGIYNIMSMTIINKLKDIAILKAQGFSRGDVLRIFLYQSLFIGVIGGLIGLLLGYIFSTMVSKATLSENEYVDMKHFPVDFDISYYIFGLAFGVLTTLLAGYLPARKASKTDPVEILRG